jgi:hypothetical protein
MGRCLCRSALPWLLVALGVDLGNSGKISASGENFRPLPMYHRDSTASVSPEGT